VGILSRINQYNVSKNKSRFRLYLVVALLFCSSLLFVLSSCNRVRDFDGISIALSQEAYDDQLIRLGNEGARSIAETNVPLGKSPAEVEEDNSNEKKFISQVLSLINEERAKEKLPPLSGENSGLNEAAKVRAFEIVDVFSHMRPSGKRCFDVLSEFSVKYRYAGENIAKGQTSPEAVVNAWMNSSGHKENIMNVNYKNVGIGVAADLDSRLHWVQLFTD